MRNKFPLLLLLLSTFSVHAQNTASLAIQGKSEHTISRHIYGHFSEHLGRCIYDGFWVDSNMNVPKKDRIRLDVVEALKKINIPIFAGREVALQMNTTGAMGSVRAASDLKWLIPTGAV